MRGKVFVGYLICIFGFGLTVWSFFPGAMSGDSPSNLNSGRDEYYYDIHSPVLSFIWGRLDEVVPGPALMFALQNLVFWGTCALLWAITYRESFLLGLALTLFGFTPHILSSLTVVWKDVGMGVALLLSVALIYAAKKKRSLFFLAVSFPFLLIGCAARLNSIIAVIPIAIWSVFVLFSILDLRQRILVTALGGICYIAVLAAGAHWITYTLTEGRTTYPFQQNYLYDLAAISLRRGEILFPDYVVRNELFVPELLGSRYNTRSVNELLYPGLPLPGDRQILPLTEDPNEVEALKDKWFETVTQHPGDYLIHRSKVFGILIGLDRSVPASQQYLGFTDSPPEYRGSENAGFQILMKYFHAFRRPFPQTFFFRAIVWLLLCAFLLYKAWKNNFVRDWDIVTALAASCLMYTLAYFPTTPSTEFRYLFWPALASAVAVIFGIYLLRNNRAERGLTAEV